jgi:quinohemoprotein ethanol dehydrogenase
MFKAIFLTSLILLSAAELSAAENSSDAPASADWPVPGGNGRGQHFSTLDQISTETIDRLGLAWAEALPVADGISATPIVVDGVIYVSGPFSLVIALDAATGKTHWRYDPEVRKAFAEHPHLSWTARSNRGVAVHDGRVLVSTADCRLIALDADSGEPQWSATTCDPARGYSITDAPRTGGGKVFIGNAGSESGKRNRGYVSAYSILDGALVWRFYTVPSANPDENDTPAMKMAATTWTGDAWQQFGGGGSVWNGITYDSDSGYVFFGTAGALPYVHRYRSPGGGDNLFLSSVLAIDAETGEYVWHYQTVPEDSWEYNATMNIVLADLEIKGKQHDVLMIAPKNGFYYVLDRLSGDFISAGSYVKVNWSSHINAETGRPVIREEGGFWKTPAGTISEVWPNMWGSHSWNPMAYHPELQLAYIPAIDAPSVVTNLGDGDFEDALVRVDEVDGKPHSPGKLIAWDPAAQRERWSVDRELPFNGGVLATAGGLVFQGDAEGDFSAYHAADGRRLWSVNTGSAINAAPVTYALDKKQYVLVPTGAGGGAQFLYPDLHSSDGARGPTRLLAFSLDGNLELPRGTADKRELPALRPTASDETIMRGEVVYAENCRYCHGTNVAARVGGSVPDLRFAAEETHAAWNGIVIGGALRSNGMPDTEMSAEDAEAIRQYVLRQADRLRRAETH